MAIKILHRMNWKNRTAAPATMVDEYSIDEGATWVSRAEFHQWHDSLIEVVDTYASAKVTEQSIPTVNNKGNRKMKLSPHTKQPIPFVVILIGIVVSCIIMLPFMLWG